MSDRLPIDEPDPMLSWSGEPLCDEADELLPTISMTPIEAGGKVCWPKGTKFLTFIDDNFDHAGGPPSADVIKSILNSAVNKTIKNGFKL